MISHWLLQRVSDVPEDDDWLSPRERDVVARLWAPKRRRDWRLGRWTVKRALVEAGLLGRPGDIRPCEWRRLSVEADEAGVPGAFIDGTPASHVVSISHSGDHGLGLAAPRPAAVGCDVETIGRRAEEFVVDYFTERERAVAFGVEGDERSRVVTTIWSAKESTLKALGVGLRLDTRQVEVALRPDGAGFDGWLRLVAAARGRQFEGWWRVEGPLALTIVSDPPCEPVSADRPARP